MFWRMIENSTDIHDFENYLTRCENKEFIGLYKAVAELKLYHLKKVDSRAVWQGIKTAAKNYMNYWWVTPWAENVNLVAKGRKYGLSNKWGTILIEPKYDLISSFSDALALVRSGNKTGYINTSGKEVIPTIYEGGYAFSDGLAGVKLNGKWGFIDRTGKVVISFKYELVYPFSGGSAWVSLQENWDGIDRNGHSAPPPDAPQNQFTFYEGLSSAVSDGRCGYIDKKKQWVINNTYDVCNTFSEGLAGVKLNGKWGIIDKTGKVVRALSLEYDHIMVLPNVKTKNRSF